jgi:hypothetical protein
MTVEYIPWKLKPIILFVFMAEMLMQLMTVQNYMFILCFNWFGIN